jgi:tRNA-specific adenosine deaminase 1
LDKKRNKLCLNTCRYQLVLYTTELPCGSCTIDINSNLFSGAKPLSAFASIDYEHNQEIIFDRNVLRTKPGRLDLPLNKRSCSLSCSDKIMMWALMGIQGKKLFRYYLPIYIDTIVVETEEKAAL